MATSITYLVVERMNYLYPFSGHQLLSGSEYGSQEVLPSLQGPRRVMTGAAQTSLSLPLLCSEGDIGQISQDAHETLLTALPNKGLQGRGSRGQRAWKLREP